jgi:hypothetical protein
MIWNLSNLQAVLHQILSRLSNRGDEIGRPTANMGEMAYAHKLYFRNPDERDH